MFTGLIEEVGKLKSIRKSSSMARVQIMASHILVDAQLGDSIACNGVCLTICKINRDSFDAELMPETLNKTQFSNYLPNAPINLERAIRADARLGGHIVSGHIDTFGRVNAINQHSNSHILQIQFDECYAGLVIPKGSIAIDGVSLTVIECTHNSMTVGIIPHTFTHTIFASLKVGGAVNLEFDGQAKYAKAALQLTEKHKNSLSLDQLSKWGY